MDYTAKELERAQQIINEERERRRKSERSSKEVFIGRFFRTRNRYSGDRGEWWLYAAVTSVSEYGHMSGLKFQHIKDKDHDSVEFRLDSSIYIDNWEEVSAADFHSAFQEAVSVAWEYHRALGAVDPHVRISEG